VKQLNPPLSAGQRTVLVYELLKLGYTVRKLRDMAENVKRRTTYGNIAFEHWMAGSVVTYEELVEERQSIQREDYKRRAQFAAEVDRMLQQRIEIAKAQLSEESQSRDKAALEAIALQDRKRSYEIARKAWYDAASIRAKRRLVECKQKLRGMDREARIAVLNLAVERGKLSTYDNAMVENIHLFPDVLLPVIDEIAKVVK